MSRRWNCWLDGTSNSRDPWRDAPPWAHELSNTLARLEKMIMPLKETVDDLETQVTAMTDAEAGAEAAFIKLAEEIAALRADQTDPATAARISSMAQTLKDRAQRLAAAVVAGTQAAPAKNETSGPIPSTPPAV